MIYIRKFGILLFFGIGMPCILFAQFVDFSKSKVYLPEESNELLQEVAKVFKEEIVKHCHITLPAGQSNLSERQSLFVIATEKQVTSFPAEWRIAINRLLSTGKDGFKITCLKDKKTLLIVGHEERGALYGIGYALRKMELRDGQIRVPENLNISSTPKKSIRGDQLGYRPKTNAYDAWSIEQFDHYIRDLALFGANSIEIMPPRTDDAFSNEHMKLPAIEMIVEQSRICEKYGLDVWMWYPNMGSDYVDPDSIQEELDERARIFSKIPKLDNLFIPGGDPGNLKPVALFNWLKKVVVVLHRYHPHAKIWVSPQVFKPTAQWYDKFYQEVNKGYSWLGGVVYGPWIKEPIRVVRQRVRKDLPLRRYPDITHSLMCQYPVPEWDLAYAMTLGRECYNPRPFDEKHIQNVYEKYADGSICYSEGINDDVNKFVWLGQNWDPSTPVMETLYDYARLFIGPDYTESVANGIVALEDNFKGPLLTNTGVQKTLHEWQDMERMASQEVLRNYRFQMCLLRAYYDAYIQNRLLYETGLEHKAKNLLEMSGDKGSLEALQQARTVLLKAYDHRVCPDLRQRCLALSDSVYLSIGSQLTEKEPQAAKAGRGNFIDRIDLPLNDSKWLLATIGNITKIRDENERLKAIHKALSREDPGPGGFYRDLGALYHPWGHVVRQKTWAEDPGGLETPFIDFGANLQGEDEWVDVLPVGFDHRAIPHAWVTTITTAYNTPFKMHYNHLDPNSNYVIRITYAGRFDSHIKLVADRIYLIHDYITVGEKPIYEFLIPKAAYADGEIDLTWSCLQGERGTQVSEVWIIKR